MLEILFNSGGCRTALLGSIFRSMHFLTPVFSARTPLPLYLTQVPAGFPSPADDYVESTVDLQRLLIRHPSATYLVRAKGNSMRPVINEGDILVVDRSLEARHGNIVIASLNGDLTVKSLFKQGGVLALLPANPDFSALDIAPDIDFQLWGVVTYIVRGTCTPS